MHLPFLFFLNKESNPLPLQVNVQNTGVGLIDRGKGAKWD